jgi:hypothetical protein
MPRAKPKSKARPARRDRPYLVATFATRPGLEIPLLSEDEYRARGLGRPTASLLDHLSPEERLRVLSPLIDLLVDALLLDIRNGTIQPDHTEAPAPQQRGPANPVSLARVSAARPQS